MKKLILFSLLILSSTSSISAGLYFEEDEGGASSSARTLSLTPKYRLTLRQNRVTIKTAIQIALAGDDPRLPPAIAKEVLETQFNLPVWDSLSQRAQRDLLGEFQTPSWAKESWRHFTVKDYRETDAPYTSELKARFEQALRNEPLFFFRVAGGGDCGAYALQLRRRQIVADAISLAQNEDVRRLLATEIADHNDDFSWVGNTQPPLPSVEDFTNYVRYRYGDGEGQLREILDTPILLIIARKYGFSLYIWTCQKGQKELSLVNAYFDPGSQAEKHILLDDGHYSNLLTSDASRQEVYVVGEIEDAREAMDLAISEGKYENAFDMAKVQNLHEMPFTQKFDAESSLQLPKRTPSRSSESIAEIIARLERYRLLEEQQKEDERRAAEEGQRSSTIKPQGYTSESFTVSFIESGYALQAPSKGAARFWFHSQPLNGQTDKGHLVQPWSLKKGQTFTINISISELTGNLELALVHNAYKQLAMLPIKANGNFKLTYTATEDMEVTPDIVCKNNSAAFQVKNVVVTIEH